MAETSSPSSSSLRRRLEIGAGRFQHKTLQSLANRVARLRLLEVTLDGVRVPYLHGGTGPPLLLLHGFADSKETWVMVLPLLTRHYTVIVPDIPGYGEADDVPPERATVQAQAAFVGALLDYVGRRSVHIVGNSMGGGIGIRLAHDDPSRVRSLTLLASIGHERAPSVYQDIIEQETGENPLLPRTLEEYDAMLELVLERRPPLNKTLRAYMADRQARMHQSYVEKFEVLRNDRVPALADLTGLDIPTLVIHGECDRLVHPSTADNYGDALTQVEVVKLAGVGHAPQLERPRLTVQLIHRHLSNLR